MPRQPKDIFFDERKQMILRLIVDDYVETAEPVASETLVSRHRLDVKSATVRNEMAEMSEMGYLKQPHTSAGRIPSDQGYRFFVDKLMMPETLLVRDQRIAQSISHSIESDLHSILTETCRVLSSLTKYASVALQTPTEETIIHRVSLSPIDAEKALLLVVFSDARVEHRILRCGLISQTELQRVSNALDFAVSGKSAGAVYASTSIVTPPEIFRHNDLFQSACAQVRQIAKAVLEGDIFIEGTRYILRQPEFQDAQKIEVVLDALERRKALFQVLSAALLGPETFIVIGSENPCVEMQEVSFVAARYSIAGRLSGTIGVVGPTRMDYARATAAVNFMANNLTDLLTSLSIR